MEVAKVEGLKANLVAVGDQHDVEGAAEKAAGIELDEEEARRPKIVRRPLAPTKETVEVHNRTHAACRD